jgi:transcriptional antiterminator NusG
MELRKQWFVLHAMSGQESKVKQNIDARIQREEMSAYIGRVLVPTEKISEVKPGGKKETERKLYPGYVFVEAALYDDDRQLIPESWAFIRSIPNTIGLIGGNRPVTLTEREVEDILEQADQRGAGVRPSVHFEPGESVRIKEGPFEGTTGIVEEVAPDTGKIKLSVSIFGRPNTVELEYWQVERGE